MKKLFKPLIVALCTILVAAGIFTSCQDDVKITQNDVQGAGAATVHLGLPGGTYAVDADGNVTVNANVHLTTGTCWVIHNYFRVQSGFTFEVDPGVTVRFANRTPDPNDGDRAPGTLIIERGADIDADGTAVNPIIFTSNQAVPASGDWGGVAILGNAFANVAASGALPNGVGGIEGLETATLGLYGNTTPVNNESSGILRYVRIEYAGHETPVANNELNGLTMGGVGSGTTIEHVIVAFGKDDGFEWFGGTVNAKYLIAYRNRDDDFDTDQGYTGKVQFGLSIRCTDTDLAATPVNGFESNGDTDDDFTTPLTNAKFANFTIVGPTRPAGGFTVPVPPYNSGAHIRDGSQLDIYNSLIFGYPDFQIELATTADFNSTVFLKGNVLVAPAGGGTINLAGAALTAFDGENQRYTVGLSNLNTLTGLPLAAWNCPGCEGTAPSYTPLDQDRPLIFRADDDENDVPAYTNLALVDGFFTATQYVGAFDPSGSNSLWDFSSNWVSGLHPDCDGPCAD